LDREKIRKVSEKERMGGNDRASHRAKGELSIGGGFIIWDRFGIRETRREPENRDC